MLLNVYRVLTVSMLSVFVSLSVAHAGANGGGGGNATASTPEQVKNAISLIKVRLNTFIQGASKGELPSEVREAFKRFNTIHQPVQKIPNSENDYTNAIWSIHNTKYNPVDGPCFDHDKNEKDSSVSSFSLGSSVCMSVTRLTRIPEESLGQTVTALAAHELTHQVGLNEEAALQVQLYVIQNYEGSWGQAGVNCYVNEYKNSVTGEVKSYQVKFGISQDCKFGCVEAVNFDESNLGESIKALRTSLAGKKVGRDGGCTKFIFRYSH